MLPIKLNSAGFLIPVTVMPWLFYVPLALATFIFGRTQSLAAAYEHVQFGRAAHIILGAVVVLNVMRFVRTTIIQEDRLTIRASRAAVYAAIADPRSAPRRDPAIVAVDDLVGELGVVGTRWRTTHANGLVFAAEVVAAEPPALIRSRHVPRWPRHVPRWRRPRITALEMERTLVATPAGTELTIRRVVHTMLLFRLVEPLTRSDAARQRRWVNERFREELEVGAENRKVLS